jgi:hypothetical protein
MPATAALATPLMLVGMWHVAVRAETTFTAGSVCMCLGSNSCAPSVVRFHVVRSQVHWQIFAVLKQKRFAECAYRIAFVQKKFWKL